MSYICEANKFDFFIADSNEKYQSNFGVVKKKSRITFDTSYSEEAFEKLFEPGEEIFLVISHNHKDHYFGARNYYKYFKTIFCGIDMVEHLIKLGCCKSQIKVISAEKNVNIANNIVIGVEGSHSYLDIIMYNTDIQVAFLGDLLLQGRHPRIFYHGVGKVIYLLEKLVHMGIVLFVPGHGKIMGVKEVVEYIEYLRYIETAKKNGISREEVRIWLLEKNIKWKHVDRLWFFLDARLEKIVIGKEELQNWESYTAH